MEVPWKEVVERAYRSYIIALKTVTGSKEETVEFSKLPVHYQAAFEACCQEVKNCFQPKQVATEPASTLFPK